MGWKSTIDISRQSAIESIHKALYGNQDQSTFKKHERIKSIMDELYYIPYSRMTNEELENLMYKLDIGDNTDLPYYGYNFNIEDN